MEIRYYGYDRYLKWKSSLGIFTNLFYAFPWHIVLSIFNRIFFCRLKIDHKEWSVYPPSLNEVEFYKKLMARPWFENDSLSSFKKDFILGRKTLLTSVSLKAGVFSTMLARIDDTDNFLDQSYDFPFAISDLYFVEKDRQHIYSSTLKTPVLNPSFHPGTMLNHTIITPDFEHVRPEVLLQSDLSNKLIEKYSDFGSVTDIVETTRPSYVTRPCLNLSALQKSLSSAKARTCRLNDTRETVRSKLLSIIPVNEHSLYDTKLRDFDNLYVENIEQMLKSTDIQTVEYKRLLLNTSLCSIVPLTINSWRFDSESNLRYIDVCDNMRYNAKILGDLSLVRITEVSSTDKLTWYANLVSLFTLQCQTSMATFYNKILLNLEAHMKNDKGIPTPIPYQDLEPPM